MKEINMKTSRLNKKTAVTAATILMLSVAGAASAIESSPKADSINKKSGVVKSSEPATICTMVPKLCARD